MKNYLELTDGICVEAYLKDVLPERIIPDTIGPDTTGEFLRMGTKHRRSKPIATCTDGAELNLFLGSAHRLIAAGDRIMSDSRMFLAPIPICSGLAYMGTSGMRNPTLGVYIEWWRNHACAWTRDHLGVLQPIYFISGSPLTGCNECAYVDPSGESHTTSVPHFSNVWRSFARVNTHYTEAKQLYDAYTLAEVIDMLLPTPTNE